MADAEPEFALDLNVKAQIRTIRAILPDRPRRLHRRVPGIAVYTTGQIHVIDGGRLN